jgi:hypothetical protein
MAGAREHGSVIAKSQESDVGRSIWERRCREPRNCLSAESTLAAQIYEDDLSKLRIAFVFAKDESLFMLGSVVVHSRSE